MSVESQPSGLDAIAWNEDGLVPVVVQEAVSAQVLMLAWMNRDSLARTLESGFAVYWSRSRAGLWSKGESSGHRQRVRGIRLDCDGDALLLKVDQIGGIACHTGHKRCFYRRWEGAAWHEDEPALKQPREIYG